MKEVLNHIYKLDCINGMNRIAKKFGSCVDLIITSPPYNLGIKYDVYNDSLSIDDYSIFVQKLCNSMFSILKNGGRVCINVPPDIGALSDASKISLDHMYHSALLKSGFLYRTKIVWSKRQITARTAWGSFQSPSNPNLLPSFEYVLVFHKGLPKKVGDKTKIDVTKEEFVEWTNALWEIKPQSSKEVNHPAPFPIELSTRLMKMYSYQDDVVLDPFMGSGTVAVSAVSTNRHYIGFDLSEDYIQNANKRLELLNQ